MAEVVLTRPRIEVDMTGEVAMMGEVPTLPPRKVLMVEEETNLTRPEVNLVGVEPTRQHLKVATIEAPLTLPKLAVNTVGVALTLPQLAVITKGVTPIRHLEVASAAILKRLRRLPHLNAD